MGGGGLLSSDIINWQDSGTNVRTALDFSSNNIQLSSGDLFTLAITGGDSIWNFALDLTNNNYAAGALRGNGVDYSSLYDMAFETYMDTSAVPEPTTMLLFGTGIAGLAAVGRRRSRK